MTRDERLQFERATLHQAAALRRSARRLAGESRADDLVQETFLRALQAWGRAETPVNVRAWLYRILRNTFINEYHRLKREQPFAAGEEDAGYRDAALSIDLRRALDELPASLRETLVAVDIEGLAYREAAARIEAPIGTVMSRLHRARERVASRLAA